MTIYIERVFTNYAHQEVSSPQTNHTPYTYSSA